MEKKTFRIIGITLLIIGALLFVYIGALTMWGDLEASFFNASLRSDEPFRELDCPAIITTSEMAYISGTFENPSDRVVDMEVRTYVTAGFVTLMNEYITNFTLQPGETKVVEVPFTAEEAAYERIVMVRMHQMKRIPLPYENASCGIVVVNFPALTGNQFIALLMGLGGIFTIGGILLWAFNARPIIWFRMTIFRAMLFLSVTAFLISLSGMLGFWGLTILLIMIWILMAGGMVWQFSTTSRKKNLKEMLEDQEKQ